MKLNIFRTFFIATFLFITSVPVFAVPTVNLDLVNSPSGIRDTFQVEVWADSDDSGLDFLSFSFDVNVDNIFNFTGYSLNSSFNDDSMFTGSDVSGSAFPGIPDEDILLATLSFTTLAFGTETINVKGLYDNMFSGMYYELPDGNLTGFDIDASLTIATPIPEPSMASLFLIGSGLMSLSGVISRLKKWVI